jgi:hypothetical protein
MRRPVSRHGPPTIPTHLRETSERSVGALWEAHSVEVLWEARSAGRQDLGKSRGARRPSHKEHPNHPLQLAT